MNSLRVHIWNCLNWKVQQFKSLKVLFKKKLDLLDQHIRRPTSHIHSLCKIGSISHFSSKTQSCKFETYFLSSFQLWTLWRKERKEEVGSLKTLPLSPFVFQSIRQRLPRLWKPFFYWVGQISHFTSNIGWKSCICIFISSVVAGAWVLDRWTLHWITKVQ